MDTFLTTVSLPEWDVKFLLQIWAMSLFKSLIYHGESTASFEGCLNWACDECEIMIQADTAGHKCQSSFAVMIWGWLFWVCGLFFFFLFLTDYWKYFFWVLFKFVFLISFYSYPYIYIYIHQFVFTYLDFLDSSSCPSLSFSRNFISCLLCLLFLISWMFCLLFIYLIYFKCSSFENSFPLNHDGNLYTFLLLYILPSLHFPFSVCPSVELSSLSLCMTNSKLGEPCFYVIGRTENTRLVVVPVSSPIFLVSLPFFSIV